MSFAMFGSLLAMNSCAFVNLSIYRTAAKRARRRSRVANSTDVEFSEVVEPMAIEDLRKADGDAD